MAKVDKKLIEKFVQVADNLSDLITELSFVSFQGDGKLMVDEDEITQEDLDQWFKTAESIKEKFIY